MSVLRVKNGDQWDIVPAIKGDTGDPAADESITDAMLVPDGIKTEIDWLWGNQLMDIREGELLQTDDAYEAPLVSLDVDGKSTQVTTTGKNLFDPTELKAIPYVQDLGDGIYEFPSSLSRFTDKRVWTNPGLTGNHVVSYERMHWNSSGNGGLRMYVHYSNGSTTFIGNTSRANRWVRVSEVIDMTDVDYISCTYNSTQNTFWRDLQIEAGSTLTAYEPYSGGAAAPSPSYPQEIVDVNELELQMVGAIDSLFAENWWYQGAVDSSGALVGRLTCIRGGFYPVTTGSTYYLRVSDGYKVRVFGYTGNDTTTYYADDTSDYAQELVWTPTGSNYVLVTIAHTDNSLITVDEHTCLYVSLTPFIGHTVPLLPDGYSLRSLPDGTKDELHLSYLRPSKREGWAWYSREVMKRVGTIDLGTLLWSKYGTQDNTFFAIISDIKRRYLGALCTAYKQVQGGVDTLTNGEFSTSSGGNTSIWFRNDSYTVAADFKAAVSGVILDYILATPITTQLDPIELPIMPSKDTTIWSDPSAQLKMTYIQDTNLIIQNLEATVADMATS